MCDCAEIEMGAIQSRQKSQKHGFFVLRLFACNAAFVCSVLRQNLDTAEKSGENVEKKRENVSFALFSAPKN